VPKKNLLLVDADPRSLRVLEISLRKAGYNVAASADATNALEMLEIARPDLILSDTRLPGMDGFALVEELRKNPEWAAIPIIFLSSDMSVESKVHGLERGVEDYLTKPIYIKEIIARVNLVLQRKQRAGLEERSGAGKTRFTGSLADMGLVDLLQTVDNSKKSGVLYVTSNEQRALMYFREGMLVDAELGSLRGERAVFRTLLWNEGTFEIDFRDVRREDVIQTSTQGVLMEGMRRLDEWGRLLEQMPKLESVFEVNGEELLRRLAELPDEVNTVLKHFDGKRSVLQIIDRSDQDDLEALTVISKLYFEGLIYETGRMVAADEGGARTAAGGESERAPALAGAEPSTGLTMAPPPAGLTVAPPDAQQHLAATVVPPAGADVPASRTAPGVAKPAPPPSASSPSRIDAAPPAAPGAEESRGRTLDYGPEPDSGAQEMSGGRAKGRRLRRLETATENTLRGLQSPLRETESVARDSARQVSREPAEAAHAPAAPASPAVAAHAGSASAAAISGDEQPTRSPAAEDAAVARSRRRRRRPKRLSLVTSPGMLSAVDPVEHGGGTPALPGGATSATDAQPPPDEAKLADGPKAGEQPARAAASAPPARPHLEPEQDRESKIVTRRSRPPRHARDGSSQPPADAADNAVRVSSTHVVAHEGDPLADEIAAGLRASSAERSRRARTLREVRAASPSPSPASVAPRPEPDPARRVESARPSSDTAASTDPRRGAASSSVQPPAERASLLLAHDRSEAVATPDSNAQAAGEQGQRDGGAAMSTVPPADPQLPIAGTARIMRAALAVALVVIGGSVLIRMISGDSSEEPAPQATAAGAPAPRAQANEAQPPADQRAAQPAPAAAPTAAPAAEPPAAEPPAALAAPQAEQAVPVPEAEAAPVPDDVAARVQRLVQEAHALEQQGKPRQALQIYEQAISFAPNDPTVLARLAFGYLNRGENEQASDYASRAVAVDPASSEGWIVLGAARHALGDKRGARDAYLKCVEVGSGPYVDECRRVAR
jgi:DNA-binding response OmpR family regulator